YLEKRFGNQIQLRSYDTGVTDVMDLVAKQQELQATLQDLPAAKYYLPRYPDLQALGEPVDPGYYVIYVRKNNPELLRQLDDALRKAIHGGKDGLLGRIYSKYGLWNDDQERLATLAEGTWPPAEAAAEGTRPPAEAAEALPSRWSRLPYFVVTLVQSA